MFISPSQTNFNQTGKNQNRASLKNHVKNWLPILELGIPYRRGDVSFPTIECVPFTHTIHGNFCHPKLGLAKTSEIHSTILRTVI